MKFIAMYMAPTAAVDNMMKNMNPELSKQHNESWKTWTDAHKGMMVDGGAPLGKNKRVTSAGITDTRNEMTGYSVIEAASHEEAANMMKDNPMLQMPEAYIEVMPLASM